MKVVACDRYVSTCAEDPQTFFGQLVPFVDPHRDAHLFFDRRGRGSRALQYYQEAANRAEGGKRQRLNDWIRLIHDQNLHITNSVTLQSPPSGRRQFFTKLAGTVAGSALLTTHSEKPNYGSEDSLPVHDIHEAEAHIGACQPLSSSPKAGQPQPSGQPSSTAPGNRIQTTELHMHIHIGDKIEASENATLVNRSTVTDSFKQIEERGDSDALKHLTTVLEFVLKSRDKELHDLFAGFSEQVKKGGEANSTVGKTIWEKIRGALSEAMKTSRELAEAASFWGQYF